MPFSRPEHIPYPSVWRSFTRTKDGKTLKFQVVDLMEDRFDEALQVLVDHFTADEPPCKYIKIRDHPSAVNELRNLWRRTLEDKLSVICVLEDTKEIVGVNVLCVCTKDDVDDDFKSEDRVWSKLYGAVEVVTKAVDIFDKFRVSAYLTAYGLVVAPKYRGMNIGMDILLARIPICRALGLNLTATVFTAAASQAIADKAGFVCIHEISYDELAEKGYKFPGITENTKSSKLMSLYIYK